VQPPEPEYLGPFRLYPPVPGTSQGGWTLSWKGEWLPGNYADRDAVMLIVGLWTGSGNPGGLVDELLETLQERHNRAVVSRSITVQDILAAW
jgi:hypothetical protein